MSKLPSIPFSALSTETRALITELQLSNNQDLRFSETVTTVPGPYDLRVWALGSKYFDLSTTDKLRVLRLIEANPVAWIGIIYQNDALYNTTVSYSNPGMLWDEAFMAKDWLKVLGLDGVDSPSGDTCLSLEIYGLESEFVDTGDELLALRAENLELRTENLALRADLQGTSRMLEKLRAILG